MTKKIIILTLTGISAFATIILPMFTEEIRNIIFSDWKLICFFCGVFLLLVFSLTLIISGLFKMEYRILYDKQNKVLQGVIDTLKESNEYHVHITRINWAICRSLFAYEQIKEPQIREIAEFLYDVYYHEGIIIPDWKAYKLDQRLINEMEKIYHEKELEKLSEQKKQAQKEQL